MPESHLQNRFTDSTITELEITPLVAIALVLVMVFMITAPLFVEPELNVEIPKAYTGEDEERENITISITSDGAWAVNDLILSFNEVSYALQQKLKKSSEKYVIIRADQQALNKWLLDAMQICKQSGAKTVSIAVKQKQRG
ncbi:MAG: biopolymer transporter ExbD [Endomicrobiales bacterium]|nr:biopolymer transporter ExbD [Endomicrobiales bacterium]